MAHTWQYQLIRHEEEDRVWFGLHEVYYKEEEPRAWTNELFSADTAEELIEQLEKMLDDIHRSPIMIENGDNWSVIRLVHQVWKEIGRRESVSRKPKGARRRTGTVNTAQVGNDAYTVRLPKARVRRGRKAPTRKRNEAPWGELRCLHLPSNGSWCKSGYASKR